MSVATPEQTAFVHDMTRHAARLMDFSKPYIGRLAASDRDFFINKAFMVAFERRELFVPGKENEGLLHWWNECLKITARSRKEWRCSTFDGTYVMVLGVKLGQELL
jgi:hypothetical protein